MKSNCHQNKKERNFMTTRESSLEIPLQDKMRFMDIPTQIHMEKELHIKVNN
jgi:hypothetical protein